MKPGKWLLIPIETKNRELASKTLLSCFTAENGYSVIMGPVDSVRFNIGQFPKGAVLELNAAVDTQKALKAYRRSGNIATAWCEEGLLYEKGCTYVARRIHRDTLNFLNVFFAWGRNQKKDILNEYPEDSEKVVISGNIRFDLLRTEFRTVYSEYVNSIKSSLNNKEFILVNTNFALCNPNSGQDRVTTMKRQGRLNYSGGEDFYRGKQNFKKEIFSHFLAMTKKLSSSFPKMNIVIRPHPSESHEPYRDLAKEVKNVDVIYDNNVIPWILASEAVIHNSCTTGVEAFLLDKPVIAYQPVVSEEFDFYLPNYLSRSARSLEELEKVLASVLSGQNLFSSAEKDEKRKTAKRYIENIDGPFASENILKVLDGLDIPPCEFDKNKRLRPGLRYSMMSARAAIAKKVYRENPQYYTQKFPGITLDEVKELITKLQQASGRFENISAAEIGKDCFVIQKD